MNILLTGGAGYIGSHTYVALAHAGYTPVILDNFSNSHRGVLERLYAITEQHVACEEGDVLDTAFVESVLRRHDIGGVIHFAGDKAVGESVANPLKYYRNNVGGAMSLLQAMQAVGCRTLVFSSSATVYGDPASVPIAEHFPRSHTNPYGHTKLIIEDMLEAVNSRAAGLAHRGAALLQPRRRARERPDRRRPIRHPQQPDAVHHAGGAGQARAPAGVRRRLPHA